MSGSNSEPQQAAEQMREATDRLREQAWMVAPLTNPPLPAQPDRIAAEG